MQGTTLQGYQPGHLGFSLSRQLAGAGSRAGDAGNIATDSFKPAEVDILSEMGSMQIAQGMYSSNPSAVLAGASLIEATNPELSSAARSDAARMFALQQINQVNDQQRQVLNLLR